MAIRSTPESGHSLRRSKCPLRAARDTRLFAATLSGRGMSIKYPDADIRRGAVLRRRYLRKTSIMFFRRSGVICCDSTIRWSQRRDIFSIRTAFSLSRALAFGSSMTSTNSSSATAERLVTSSANCWTSILATNPSHDAKAENAISAVPLRCPAVEGNLKRVTFVVQCTSVTAQWLREG
jgi:hypothetical protein